MRPWAHGGPWPHGRTAGRITAHDPAAIDDNFEDAGSMGAFESADETDEAAMLAIARRPMRARQT